MLRLGPILLTSGILLFFRAEILHAQFYTKWLENPERSLQKHQVALPNGEMLLAYATTAGLTSEPRTGIWVTRLDRCGREKWSQRYQWKQNYLEVKDMASNSAGEVLLLGTAFDIGNQEYVFLLKLDPQGKIQRFALWHFGTVDNFTYGLSWEGGQIAAYGLLLDWFTPKRGFIAFFDQDLRLQGGQKFEPFESSGGFLRLSDGAWLCRSASVLYKFGPKGQLLWAKKLALPDGNIDMNLGPIQWGDGYLFGSYSAGSALFFSTDDAGTLLWQSPHIPAALTPPTGAVLPNGDCWVFYAGIGAQANQLCRLRFTPQGPVLDQAALQSDKPLPLLFLDASTDSQGGIQLLCSTEPVGSETTEGMVMRLYPNAPNEPCEHWEPFQNQGPNSNNVVLTPFVPDHFAPLSGRFVEGSLQPTGADFFDRDRCGDPSTLWQRTDTTLACSTPWTIQLPGPGFAWDDGTRAPARQLTTAGTASATKLDVCAAPVVHEFVLEKEPCACNLYLPNAFSPNDDGEHEYLTIESDCALETVWLAIYNRWGEQVFSTHDPNAAWDGTFRQRPLETGVYVARLTYQLRDEGGALHSGSLIRDILLVR